MIGGAPSSSSRMSPSLNPAESTVATVDDEDAATSALPSINSCPASPIQVALRSRMGVGITLEVAFSGTNVSSFLAVVVDFDTIDVHSGG